MVRIGYVGLNTELDTPSKTFKLTSYSEERMLQVAKANLEALEKILNWNIDNKIKIFRITSQLIPFASHPINSGSWKTLLKKQLQHIGYLALSNNMRLSMHPGQYTVLNTPNFLSLKNSLADLEYHSEIMALMGLDDKHRIIIHGGGAYGNKYKSLKVLIQRIKSLPIHISKRLALENDDKIFTAEDILRVCLEVKIPAIVDVFHHQILPSLEKLSVREVILLFENTWLKNERQKIHFSNQDPKKQAGTHSQTIDTTIFEMFYQQIRDLDLDIMLEAKDKQRSVLILRKYFPDLH